jgi:hypothetical protein
MISSATSSLRRSCATSRWRRSSSSCRGSDLGPRFLGVKATTVARSRAFLQSERIELYSPCLRRMAPISPGSASSVFSRIARLNAAVKRRRPGFSSVSLSDAFVCVAMASLPFVSHKAQ